MNHRIFVCLLLCLSGCSQPPVKPFPAHDLLSAIRQSEIVDLSVSVPILWDHVFIFGPYSIDAEIQKVAGASIPTQVSEFDSHCLLVFMHDGHATGYVELERMSGDFAEYSGKNFLRSDACFRKVVDGAGWIKLKFEK